MVRWAENKDQKLVDGQSRIDDIYVAQDAHIYNVTDEGAGYNIYNIYSYICLCTIFDAFVCVKLVTTVVELCTYINVYITYMHKALCVHIYACVYVGIFPCASVVYSCATL